MVPLRRPEVAFLPKIVDLDQGDEAPPGSGAQEREVALLTGLNWTSNSLESKDLD